MGWDGDGWEWMGMDGMGGWEMGMGWDGDGMGWDEDEDGMRMG